MALFTRDPSAGVLGDRPFGRVVGLVSGADAHAVETGAVQRPAEEFDPFPVIGGFVPDALVGGFDAEGFLAAAWKAAMKSALSCE